LLYTAGILLAVCIFLETPSLPSISSPFSSAKAFFTQIGDIAVPGDFSRLQASARARTVAEEPLAAGTLSLLRGRTIAIEPWEDLVAWADPAAQWEPEPVLQAYSAYTSYLDHLDAAFLASRRAPQLLLYQLTSIGGRNPAWDPPATTEAMYCHYRALTVSGPWLLLQRAPDRCGQPGPIGSVTARFGQRIDVAAVPRPGQMIVATFTLTSPLTGEVAGVLLKPPAVYVRASAGGGRPTTYRFVTGTAGDPHVLSVPSSLGYPPGFVAPVVRQVELSGGGWAAGQGRVRVSFYSVSLLP